MINIAILGFGKVGSGVAEVISRGYNLICKEIQDSIQIKYILDLRDFPGSPYQDLIVHDIKTILEDPEVKIVCETMGGTKPAFEYSMACLRAGKSVVTSNKEVVANFGNLLCDAARDNGVRYLYEASVGGGIPVIRPIKNALAANEIYEINGILNGTTNYILTEMDKKGKSFDDALAQAQALGYAERDPRADINGDDACRKICILAALAFGTLVAPSMVNCIGIRDITQTDVSIAKKFGGAVKLVGSTKRMPDGTIDIRVTPCLVPPYNPMVKVDDVYNAIMVRAASLGDVMFYGQGAGSLPTGSAVLSDIMDIAKHLKTKQPTQETWESSDSGVVCDAETTPTSYYAAVNLTPDELTPYIEDIEVLHTEDGLTAFIAHGISHKSFEFALAAAGAQVFSKLRAL
ncbi:MAG: homoserine dehydrogenase [Clostridia bacterium]|nr:homoserine dehydrogenase [Clostridia bacterium]